MYSELSRLRQQLNAVEHYEPTGDEALRLAASRGSARRRGPAGRSTRRLAPRRIAGRPSRALAPGRRDRERAAVRLGRADERIGVVVEPGELRVVQPRVPDELELTRDVRVQADEVEAALLLASPAVSRAPRRASAACPYSRPRRRMRCRRLISRDFAVPGLGSSESRGFERRMCAPIGQRAPSRIELVVAEVVRLREAGSSPFRRERQRGAARPAADDLRGEPKRALGVGRPVGASRRAVEEAPETPHVLAQLAEDEIAAVLGPTSRRASSSQRPWSV